MFGLDPQSIAERAKNSPSTPIPSLAESLIRGVIGFTLVSLGGFAPWIIAGSWFYRNTGEIGLYVVCAVAFIASSGPLMHRLIIGPGSLPRFYKLFSFAFIAYAIVWTIGWISLRGAIGGIVGGLAGMAAMGGIFALGFGVPKAALKIIVVLFVANLAGYFVGEWAHNGALALKEGNATGLVLEKSTRVNLAKAVWGILYGMGFGAGIGAAFYYAQTEARKLIAGNPTALG